MADQGKSQQDQRLTMNGTDRFGREYVYSIETHTKHGGVCGQITCITEHKYEPPQKYLAVDKRRPYTVRVLFDEWRVELEEARRDWQRRYDTLVRQLPQSSKTEIEDLVGEKPLDPTIIDRMKRGDWKVLTASSKPPKRTLTPPDEEEAPFLDAAPVGADDADGIAVGSKSRR